MRMRPARSLTEVLNSFEQKTEATYATRRCILASD